MGAAVETKASVEGVESQAQSGAATPASVKTLPQRKKSTLHATFTHKTVWVCAIFILVSSSILSSSPRECSLLFIPVLCRIGGQHGRLDCHFPD